MRDMLARFTANTRTRPTRLGSMERTQNEPRLIQINPAVGFGKPVIAGTGISTAVVASRFNARESIDDLASEYGLKPRQIEEAIRWEQRTGAVAA